MEEGLLAADGESLLSLSAFALTKRLGEEVTRGLKACFTAAGRRPPAVLEAELIFLVFSFFLSRVNWGVG